MLVVVEMFLEGGLSHGKSNRAEGKSREKVKVNSYVHDVQIEMRSEKEPGFRPQESMQQRSVFEIRVPGEEQW